VGERKEVGGELKPVNCMVGRGDSVREEESNKSKDFGAMKLSGRKLSSLVIEVENWRECRNVGQTVVSTPRVLPSERHRRNLAGDFDKGEGGSLSAGTKTEICYR
jgi:hypothetical protein